MNELEQLARNLFNRADGTKTTNFKVFLGRDSEVQLDDVCAEINKVFAQEKTGCLEAVKSIDGHLKRVPLASIASI